MNTLLSDSYWNPQPNLYNWIVSCLNKKNIPLHFECVAAPFSNKLSIELCGYCIQQGVPQQYSTTTTLNKSVGLIGISGLFWYILSINIPKIKVACRHGSSHPIDLKTLTRRCLYNYCVL